MKTFKLVTLLFAFITTALVAAPKNLALDGYCPVCYKAAGKANKGSAEFASEYNGKTYYFVSSDVKAMFDKEPTKWLPEYDGWCAYGMTFGKKFETDPTVFKVVNDKVYLNKNAAIAEKFNEGTAAHITKADAEWEKMTMKK